MLTDDDLAVLGTDIRANTDPIVVDALAAGDDQTIAAYYSEQTSPDFWGLRQFVGRNELIDAMDWAADYLAFQADIPAIEFLLDSNDGYDPTTPSSREALNTLFAGASTSKTAILAAATKLVNRVEELFAFTTTGPGGGDGSAQVSSAGLSHEGIVSAAQVTRALVLSP